MKILLIDDDHLTIFLTKQWLILDGFSGRIEYYLSSTEALQYLLRCPDSELPDLIFLDLNMPVMSGWEFLDSLAPYEERFRNRCFIYILTSSLCMEDEQRSQDCNMVSAFIHKPIKPEDLEMIRDQLGLDMKNSGYEAKKSIRY